MEKTIAKLGAALYVCWGLLHFTAAYGVYKLAQSAPPTIAQGRLMQTAFYLAVFAATAIVLALTRNWRNDRIGFWVNGVMVGIADIPFILFVLIPGYAPWWPGLLGPVLWLAAFAITGLARIGATGPSAANLLGIAARSSDRQRGAAIARAGSNRSLDAAS